jgi:hypothetical protein
VWQWLTQSWELIFGVLGVVGFVITVLAWVQQRQPKQLDWELLTDIRLLDPNFHDWQLRVVSDDGQTIDDPRIVTLRIKNTGKKAISRKDFIDGEPIRSHMRILHPSTCNS